MVYWVDKDDNPSSLLKKSSSRRMWPVHSKACFTVSSDFYNSGFRQATRILLPTYPVTLRYKMAKMGNARMPINSLSGPFAEPG
jgi:hypothetical protein